MNKYAQLIEGVLIPAPNQVIKNGFIIKNPNESLLKELGYKPLKYDEQPEISTPGNLLKEVYTDQGDYIQVSYEEYTPEIIQEPYKDQVVKLIRKKYSENDELAILRQQSTKPEEFKTYFEYCEECKSTIKEKLGIL